MIIESTNENIYCYSAVQVNCDTPAVVYSTYEQNQVLSGDIYISTDKTTLKISKTKGDYEKIRSIAFNNAIFSVCTKYESRKKEILFFEGKENGKFFSLTTLGKYDNPEMVAHNGKLYVFWENAGNYTNYIEYITIDMSNYFISNVCKLTASDETAYMPKAISDGENLYLFYEAFCSNRYSIMLRVLAKDKTAFSNEIQTGFDKFNDNSISLFENNGNIFFSFENSSPLFTDYTWISPDNSVITMPSFGHGWRVGASTGVRKARIENDNIIVEKIVYDGEEVSLLREEGSGEAVVFVNEEIIYLAYLEKAENIYWKLAIEYYDGCRFEKLETEEILFERRTKPVIILDDEINVLNCISENGKKVVITKKIPFIHSGIKKEYEFAQHMSSSMDNIKSTMKNENTKRNSIRVKGEKLCLYWGDLHMHSNISGCSLHKKFHCTEIEQKHRFSKDVGGLDFDLLTDHEGMSDFQWNMTKKYAHLANINHYFVSFVGFEWTSSMFTDRKNYGHYNVLYKDDGDLRRIHTGEYDSIEKLWNSLEKGKALTIPHHPGDEYHTLDWDYFNADFEPLVEIYQVRGSYEYDNCLMRPENYGRTTVKNNSVQTGLNKGYRFGFTSGGEHEGVGITGVFAKELTRESIFEALVNRRTFGTTSEKIFIDFRVNDELFGGVVKTKERNLEFQIAIKGTCAVARITIVTSHGEMELDTEASSKQTMKISRTFEKMPDWIYLRIVQEDKNMAWTSPVWIEYS